SPFRTCSAGRLGSGDVGSAPGAVQPSERRQRGRHRPMSDATDRSDLSRKPHRRPYASVLDVIGWTPLIRLTRVTEGIRTPVYGKAEFMNPGGSVKDRIGP